MSPVQRGPGGLRSRPFPDRLAVLPSERYAFGPPVDSTLTTGRIVADRTLCTGVRVVACNIGLLGLDFAGTLLGGFRRVTYAGNGEVPEAEIANREEMLRLQASRLRIATFTAACIFGVHAKRNHIAIVGAWLPTLEEVYGWVESADGQLLMPAHDVTRLQPRLRARRSDAITITVQDVEEGFLLADRLLGAAPTYASADPVAMMAMAYQAMILHGRQHPGASIALAAVVVEAAIEELVQALGFVSGTSARLTGAPVASSPISRRTFKELRLKGMIDLLAAAGAIDAFLVRRVDALRVARNSLMHDAQEPGPTQSGEGLTTVRDVLRLCTAEPGFELNTGFSYRE